MTSKIPGLALILTLALASGCSDSTTGIVLGIGAVHHGTPDMSGDYPDPDAGEPRAFTSAEGYDVVVTKAYVMLSSQELLAQESVLGFVPEMLQRVFGVRSAFAHAAASPTRLETPYALDILGHDRALLSIGTLTPPPGVYDRLGVGIVPAQDHAHGLPDDVPGGMVGKSLYIEGTWKPAGMEVMPTAFSVTSTDSIETEIPLRDRHGEDTPIVLPGLVFQIVVGLGYETWFDSVDFDSMDAGEVEAAVMDEVADSITHFVDEVHIDDEHEHE